MERCDMTTQSVLHAVQRFLVNVVILVLVSVLMVVVAELIIRWRLAIPSDYLKKIVQIDTSLVPAKRLRPGLDAKFRGAYREFQFQVTTDTNGFRVTAPKEMNARLKPEIVILGDSQTFGVGVDDENTYASALSGLIGRPVLNTGCSGYNNYEELALARSIISYLKPECLVLAFFAGNDPYENYRETSSVTSEVFSENTGSMSAKIKNWLSKKSAIYNLLIRLRRYGWINDLFLRTGLVQDTPPAELEIFTNPPSEHAQVFWEATRKPILDLAGLCRAHDIEFMVLFIPDRYQVEDSYWRQWVQKYRLDASLYDLDAPNKYMQDLCSKNGIKFLDVTPKLRTEQLSGISMYWKIDNHLSPEGHKVVAENMATVIGRRSVGEVTTVDAEQGH
jgi:lysophospholipase L1-like esterase